MARLPRYVIPGQPQHIIQRGNNRQVIFAAEADYRFFRDALVEAAARHGLAIHAFVWMTNHVHLLATPALEDSISKKKWGLPSNLWMTPASWKRRIFV